jgi:hypothetical protein
MSAAAPRRQKQPNVTKAPAHPKRSTKKPDVDHPQGLWVDWELLRKHMSSRQPRFVLPSDSGLAANNRYLELADLALDNIEIMPMRGLSELKRKKA